MVSSESVSRSWAATPAARSCAAQTTTDGPEPDSVTPTAPSVALARIAPSSGASPARYCSCSRSLKAARSSSASPEATAAPSSAAKPAFAAASACVTVSGRPLRDCGGARARRGHGEHRRERQVVGDPRGAHVAAVPPRDADAAEQRGRDVVGVALEAHGVRRAARRDRPSCRRRRCRRRGRARSRRRSSRARARAGSG